MKLWKWFTRSNRPTPNVDGLREAEAAARRSEEERRAADRLAAELHEIERTNHIAERFARAVHGRRER